MDAHLLTHATTAVLMVGTCEHTWLAHNYLGLLEKAVPYVLKCNCMQSSIKLVMVKFKFDW